MSGLTRLLEQQKVLQQQMTDLETEIQKAKESEYTSWGELFSRLFGDDLFDLLPVLTTASEEELAAIREDVLPVLTASAEATAARKVQQLFPMNPPEESSASSSKSKTGKRTSRKKVQKKEEESHDG